MGDTKGGMTLCAISCCRQPSHECAPPLMEKRKLKDDEGDRAAPLELCARDTDGVCACVSVRTSVRACVCARASL